MIFIYMAFSNNKSIFSLIGTTQTKLINFKFQERERERQGHCNVYEKMRERETRGWNESIYL